MWGASQERGCRQSYPFYGTPLLSSYLLLYLTCTGETGFEPASSCLGGMCSSVELLARDVRTKQYGPDGVRTRILMIRSHALIQLSYEANARNRTCTCTNSVVSGVFYFWTIRALCTEQDSNLRLSTCQADVLPLELSVPYRDEGNRTLTALSPGPQPVRFPSSVRPCCGFSGSIAIRTQISALWRRVG